MNRIVHETIMPVGAGLTEPEGWDRVWRIDHAIRYETDVDLTCLLRNLAIAGGLEKMFRLGLHYDAPTGIKRSWMPNTQGIAAP